jgi:hypothetical protein
MIKRSLLLAVCFGSCLVLMVAGCKRQAPEQKTRLLPEVPANNKNFSRYRPANPFSPAGDNLFTRTVFAADGPPGYRLEVRELIVTAHKRTEAISLPGGALFEVRYGSGALDEGGKRREIKAGSTFLITEGETVTMENTSELPLVARVYLVKAR